MNLINKNVFSLVILSYCLFTGFFVPNTFAQDDTFSKLKELETEIDDEFKWLQEETQNFVTVATKTKVSAQDAPAIVTVITEEQIRNMGARNIVDILRTVPGFDLVHYGIYPMHSTIVRGIASSISEKLKIMTNGHSIQPFWGEPDIHFDKLPINNISKIEIIRGPGSALYGTGAFIGVINIITKQGGDESSQIGFEGGSYDTAKPYAELSYIKDDLKTYIYAEHFRTDGYDGTVESDMGSAFPGYAPSESRQMTDSQEHFTIQSNINYKNFYFSGFFQNANSEIPIGSYNVLTDEDNIDTYYAYGELGYKGSITGNSNLMIKTYYDYSYNRSLYEVYPEETTALNIGFPVDEGLFARTSGKWSVAGFEINGDYEPWSGIQMVAGASYEYHKQFDTESWSNANNTGDFLKVNGVEYPPYPYQYFPEGLTDISENGNWLKEINRTTTALYVQGTVDLKKVFSLEKGVKNLAVTVGARYDNYDDVGSSTNPRFGIVYAPIEKLWFKALYGTAFRAPSFLELYLDNVPYKGNSDLKPEKISTTEFLIGYKFNRIFNASLTGFYINAEDIIRVAAKEFGYQYENAGEIQSYGVEAEFKAAFGKDKYAYLNFTWQDVKDTSKAQIFSQGGQVYTQEEFGSGSIPEFYGNIGINYGFTENIIANVSLNYVGERERTEEKMWFEEILIDMDSREPVDDRWLVNASLTFKNIMTKGLDFQLSGFNLLNQDHRDPDMSGFIVNDIPQPGATYYGNVSYSF